MKEAKRVRKENSAVQESERKHDFSTLKEANIAGHIRSIRLEIGDSVRIDGEQLAANMLGAMPTLNQADRLRIIMSAQDMMQHNFGEKPELLELLAIEQFFQTCLEISKSLVQLKKTKLGIQTKDAIIKASVESKERERKVKTKQSLDNIKVTKVNGEKVFSHTALDLVKDVFYVSEALDKDSAKLMKKLCDRILVSSELDALDKEAMVELFNKPLFVPLKKFITFR
ncbi:MAG: hypothetical protein ACK5JL_07420 [Candidatus Kapaibacterium sp.]